MLERDMEELIARHPQDFFPRQQLTLKGRQETFKGVGRFDLCFTDQFQSMILMELKAVPARYEDATQLAKYRDAMRLRGDKRVIMWLIAPLIPVSVREFLSHIGIEYAEIHESEFYRVAELHTFSFTGSDTPLTQGLTGSKLSDVPVNKTSKRTARGGYGWHFNTDESERPGSTERLINAGRIALWGYSNTEQKVNRPLTGDPVLFYKSGVGVVASAFIGLHAAALHDGLFENVSDQIYSRKVTDLVHVPDRLAVKPSELRGLGVTGPFLGSLCARYPLETANAVRSTLESRQL